MLTRSIGSLADFGFPTQDGCGNLSTLDEASVDLVSSLIPLLVEIGLRVNTAVEGRQLFSFLCDRWVAG